MCVHVCVSVCVSMCVCVCLHARVCMWELFLWALERKLTGYADIRLSCRKRGWDCMVFTIEVECGGFVGHFALRFLWCLGAESKAICS